MGLFDKFRKGLQKTRDLTIGNISNIFTNNKIDEETLENLEEALLEADVGVDSVDLLLENMREKGKNEKNLQPVEILKEEIKNLINQPEKNRIERFSQKPWVIILVGVNGSGKTTTIGKLARKFGDGGKKVAIAAADTFRAAAIEQIEIWAQRTDARLIKQKLGADPAAVTYDAYQSVLSRKEDVLLVDTAGRLQDKENLMRELSKITRILKRFDEHLPHEVLLIIDATTGQNGLSQAKGFAKSAGVTGIVVSKLDGSARGGVIIPIIREMNFPIEFVGMGEGADDLYPFETEAYTDALLSKE